MTLQAKCLAILSMFSSNAFAAAPITCDFEKISAVTKYYKMNHQLPLFGKIHSLESIAIADKDVVQLKGTNISGKLESISIHLNASGPFSTGCPKYSVSKKHD